MNVLLLIYYIGLLISVTKSCQQLAFIRDDNFLDKKQTEGKLMTKMEILNGGDCGLECQANDKCVSFFHNSRTKECQLNSAIYLSTDGSQSISGTQYYRKQLECPVPPKISHAVENFDRSTVARSEGTRLEYQCHVGYLPEPEGLVTCQVTGQWTAKKCFKFQRTCREVHQCDSSYPDGDYWIYPAAYGNKRVKIFCHDLAGTPAEFVSLPIVNKGYYPNDKNKDCNANGESKGACDGSGVPYGTTDYYKIKVSVKLLDSSTRWERNVAAFWAIFRSNQWPTTGSSKAVTMVVDRSDSTYIEQRGGAIQKYGEANDCYCVHSNNEKAECGPRGKFNINLMHTGLKVDPALKFENYGLDYWGQALRKNGGTEIYLLCGGWPGGCKPIGDMKLIVDETKVPEENTATVPHCVDG